MHKSLNQLLDNDCLIPSQEREIRRLIKYELFYNRDNNDLSFDYCIKLDPTEKNFYTFRGNVNLEIIRNDFYKHILLTLVISKELKISCEKIKAEYKNMTAYLEHPDSEWRKVAKCQYLYDLWKRVENY